MSLASKLALILYLAGGWEDGYATHYSRGVFERVERNRGLPHVACNISSPRHPIGTWLLVEGVKTDKRLTCRVSDTSQPWDRPRHLRTRLFELDYYSAQIICGKWWRSRWLDCPVR